MSDLPKLAQAVFTGCAAAIGPLIGLELEVGPQAVETETEPPQGDLAVLPIATEIGGREVGNLWLYSPTADIAKLARRMLDDEAPDKEREPSAPELDSIAELLTLMGRAVDAAVREQFGETVRLKPLTWWRNGKPGAEGFPAGEVDAASGELRIPSSGAATLVLRIPRQLFSGDAQTSTGPTHASALLLGCPEELAKTLQPLLEAQQLRVENRKLDDPELAQLYPQIGTILLPGDGAEDLALCQRLRRGHDTWQIPSLLCLREPTQSAVIRAMESGASHVLAVPADAGALREALRLAKKRA